MSVKVITCNRGFPDRVKIRLDIDPKDFETIKAHAKEHDDTPPKQMMEDILNWWCEKRRNT